MTDTLLTEIRADKERVRKQLGPEYRVVDSTLYQHTKEQKEKMHIPVPFIIFLVVALVLTVVGIIGGRAQVD